MKLVKITKYHYIYELSEKEIKSKYVNNKFRYVLFYKDNYDASCKPDFFDIYNCDWETKTLEKAIEFSINY